MTLLALVACGSSTQPPAQPGAETIDATPSDPAVDQLEIITERSCGCTDDGCRVAARDSLHALDDVKLPETARVHAALANLRRCLEPALWALVTDELSVMLSFQDRMCSCDTGACGQVVLRELQAWRDEGGVIRPLVMTEDAMQNSLQQLLYCADQLQVDEEPLAP